MTAAKTHIRPQGDLFDDMREGFSFVAEEARHVRINRDRLTVFAAELPSHPPFNVLDSQHHFTGSDEETAAYIMTLDAINFGSGYAPPMEAEGWQMVDRSVYFTISTRLKKRFEAQGLFSADDLAAFTPAQATALLQLPDAPHGREFAALCAESLWAMGRFINDEGRGSFLSIIEQASGLAENLVRTLSVLPHFADIHDYHGRQIAFFKRAQITAADLHLAFKRRGRDLFRDIGRLTMFPDNAVPHVLWTEGVLEYAGDLAAQIAAGEEIPSGSKEEIELRACAAHAVELIAAGKGMIAMDIDHILWHRSVEDPRYAQSPAHRTLSWFY